mgnify:CR=1 FL=1
MVSLLNDKQHKKLNLSWRNNMRLNSVFNAFIVMVLLFCATSVIAKGQEKQYLLTEKTYKQLSAAQKLMEAEKYSLAESKLKDLLKKVKAASYEMAVVRQTLGYLYSSRTDYAKASKQFQLALNANVLPEKVSHALRYNLAQLLLADERYKEGIKLLSAWIKAEPSPPASAYVLLSSAFYRIKNYKETITFIRLAIKKDKSAKEAWYQVLLSAHLELKQYQSAIKVLESLITHHPYKKTYWTQLSSLYLNQKKDFTALAVKVLAERLELEDKKVLINMAAMYRYLQIPYKSGKMLEKGMSEGIIPANYKHLNSLADSWIAAKEADKAADVLQRLAKIDSSGESALKQGRVLFGLEKWQQTIKPLTTSLQKLKGPNRGSALLLLGMTYVHLGELNKAKNYFSKATSFEKERHHAGQWWRHVERQLEAKNNES